jgi:integrase/recombinase XerD
MLIEKLIIQYKQCLKQKGHSRAYINQRTSEINHLKYYLGQQKIKALSAVDEVFLIRFLKYLQLRGLAIKTRYGVLLTTLRFFKYLHKKKIFTGKILLPGWYLFSLLRRVDRTARELSDNEARACIDERLSFKFNLTGDIERFIALKKKQLTVRTSRFHRQHLEEFNRYLNHYRDTQRYSTLTIPPGLIFNWIKENQRKGNIARYIQGKLAEIKHFILYLAKEKRIPLSQAKAIGSIPQEAVVKARDINTEEEFLHWLKAYHNKDRLCFDFTRLINEFLDYQVRLGYYSNRNIRNVHYTLRAFNRFLDKQRISSLEQIRALDILEYFKFLRRNGRKNITIDRILLILKDFFRYLKLFKLIRHNPTEVIKALKRYYLSDTPQVILTEKEAYKMLKAVERTTHQGKRDFIILLLLYGLGLRKFELLELTLEYIDFKRGFLYVKQAKAGHQRHLPLLLPIANALREYLELRPKSQSIFLFPSRRGPHLRRTAIDKVVAKYLHLAGIKKHITPHSLRRSCASHLHNQGVDISIIAEILGHTNLTHTLRYIIKTKEDLRSILLSHPGLKLTKQRRQP